MKIIIEGGAKEIAALITEIIDLQNIDIRSLLHQENIDKSAIGFGIKIEPCFDQLIESK